MNAEHTPVETDRLVLRPLTEADGPALGALYADPQVAQFIGGASLDQAASQRQADRFAAVWNSRGYGQSILHDRATGAVIGRVGLHPWEAWGEL